MSSYIVLSLDINVVLFLLVGPLGRSADQAVAVGKMGRMTFNWPPLPLPTQPPDGHHRAPQLKPSPASRTSLTQRHSREEGVRVKAVDCTARPSLSQPPAGMSDWLLTLMVGQMERLQTSYWTSCNADCWPKVAFQMYRLGSGVWSSACVLYREAINYFAIRISWWPIRIRIRISNLKFLINYN